MKKIIKLSLYSFVGLSLITSACAHIDAYYNDASYCQREGGQVVSEHAEFVQEGGASFTEGLSHDFCDFHYQDSQGYSRQIQIGLAAFASSKPNLAATYAAELPLLVSEGKLSPDQLVEGPYSNPNDNVCYQLGGTTITFVTEGGGFVTHNEGSEQAVCVFPDGSFAGSFDLFLLAKGNCPEARKVNSQPLEITIPIPHRGE